VANKYKKNKILTALLVILLFLIFMFFVWRWENSLLGVENQKENFQNSFTELLFDNGATIRLEIADSPELRARGLSGREGLNENTGLFFIFDEPGWHGIWMKEMNFPIDIVWLDEELKIINSSRSVSPDTYPQVFYPSSPALYVLEVNAGFLGKNRIKDGETVQLN